MWCHQQHGQNMKNVFDLCSFVLTSCGWDLCALSSLMDYSDGCNMDMWSCPTLGVMIWRNSIFIYILCDLQTEMIKSKKKGDIKKWVDGNTNTMTTLTKLLCRKNRWLNLADLTGELVHVSNTCASCGESCTFLSCNRKLNWISCIVLLHQSVHSR